MSASLPGAREMPISQYDLSTYAGRVRHAMDLVDPRTLMTSQAGLEHAKSLVVSYKQGQIKSMTPELWRAKKVIDSTLHPDTGETVLLPFRMSCFVFSNLIVTAGMLLPNLTTRGTIGWQIANQSLNVAINASNANKSSPISTSTLVKSYFLAVSASCGVAVGLNAAVPRLRVKQSTRVVLTRLVPFAAVATAGVLNVFLMRSDEIQHGIDVYPKDSVAQKRAREAEGREVGDSSVQTVGKSRKAAWRAVGETALSRVTNATPIMVIPPLVLVRLQASDWLKHRPRAVLPVNLSLIMVTSVFALPLALAIFPQREQVKARKLEERFWDKGGDEDLLEFNRGI